MGQVSTYKYDITTDIVLRGCATAMALPIWGQYMKSCYEDESLNVSKANFQKPKNLSINVDCSKHKKDIKDDDPEDIPDELEL